CLIRILAGAMLCYTHAVWTLDLPAFFGEQSWINATAYRATHGESYGWSLLWFCESPTVLWAVHIAGLVVFVLFTIGLWTRPMSVLAFVLTVSYAHRAPLAMFGLDQINAMLAMHLLLAPCGAMFSVDAWRVRRMRRIPIVRSTSSNIATRLIQVHLCVLYLFAGMSKLQGQAWWDGTAIWNAVANLEYQSLDMTWLSRYPLVINVLTHVTIAWEIS